MEVLRDKKALRARIHHRHRGGKRLGFVPTMGALHAGHLSLVERARIGCDAVLVSIFVNPLQFGPREDLSRYPRDLENDLRQLDAAGCDLVFAPESAEMYAPDATTIVDAGPLGDRLCGRTRPGHFRGVTTVVAKLFDLVQPDVAVFGQKDAQQALLVRRMVRDLDYDVELRFGPIVREGDGLAMSSRNAYLSREARHQAVLLSQGLGEARAALVAGERRARVVVEKVRSVLARGPEVRVDYVELVHPGTLESVEHATGDLLLAVAAWVGETRLIDNLLLRVQGKDVREVDLGDLGA